MTVHHNDPLQTVTTPGPREHIREVNPRLALSQKAPELEVSRNGRVRSVTRVFNVSKRNFEGEAKCSKSGPNTPSKYLQVRAAFSPCQCSLYSLTTALGAYLSKKIIWVKSQTHLHIGANFNGSGSSDADATKRADCGGGNRNYHRDL